MYFKMCLIRSYQICMYIYIYISCWLAAAATNRKRRKINRLQFYPVCSCIVFSSVIWTESFDLCNVMQSWREVCQRANAVCVDLPGSWSVCVVSMLYLEGTVIKYHSCYRKWLVRKHLFTWVCWLVQIFDDLRILGYWKWALKPAESVHWAVAWIHLKIAQGHKWLKGFRMTGCIACEDISNRQLKT